VPRLLGRDGEARSRANGYVGSHIGVCLLCRLRRADKPLGALVRQEETRQADPSGFRSCVGGRAMAFPGEGEVCTNGRPSTSSCVPSTQADPLSSGRGLLSRYINTAWEPVTSKGILRVGGVENTARFSSITLTEPECRHTGPREGTGRGMTGRWAPPRHPIRH
jgi:hypothetical protein